MTSFLSVIYSTRQLFRIRLSLCQWSCRYFWSWWFRRWWYCQIYSLDRNYIIMAVSLKITYWHTGKQSCCISAFWAKVCSLTRKNKWYIRRPWTRKARKEKKNENSFLFYFPYLLKLVGLPSCLLSGSSSPITITMGPKFFSSLPADPAIIHSTALLLPYT